MTARSKGPLEESFMQYLDDVEVAIPLPFNPEEEISIDVAIEAITQHLSSLDGKAAISCIPVGRRTVFGRLRDDPRRREEVTLLIVSDETRPAARAELFIHARTIDDDQPDSISRLDEVRPRHLPFDDGSEDV
jgi:hypothetical protein